MLEEEVRINGRKARTFHVRLDLFYHEPLVVSTADGTSLDQTSRHKRSLFCVSVETNIMSVTEADTE